MPIFFSDFFKQKVLILFILIISLIPLYKKKIPFKFLFALILIYCSLFISFFMNFIYITNFIEILLELFRPLISFIIFIGLYVIITDYDIEKINKMSKKIVYFSIITELGFVILHYTPLINIIEIFYDLSKLRLSNGIFQSMRMVGTFENPNYLGFFSILLVSLIYFFKYNFKKKEIVTLNFILTLFIFMSGSRTALIVLFFQMVLYYKIILIILSLVFPFVYPFILRIPRFTQLISPDSIDKIQSFSMRYDIVQKGKMLFYDRPFFGYGESPINITDNYFLMFVLRYGLFFYFMLMISFVIILFNKGFTNKQYLKKKIQIVIYYFLPIFVFLLTGSFFDNFRLLYLSMAILILIIQNNKKMLVIKNQIKEESI